MKREIIILLSIVLFSSCASLTKTSYKMDISNDIRQLKAIPDSLVSNRFSAFRADSLCVYKGYKKQEISQGDILVRIIDDVTYEKVFYKSVMCIHQYDQQQEMIKSAWYQEYPAKAIGYSEYKGIRSTNIGFIGTFFLSSVYRHFEALTDKKAKKETNTMYQNMVKEFNL